MQAALTSEACHEAADTMQAIILVQRMFLQTQLLVHGAAVIQGGRNVTQSNLLCGSKDTMSSHHAAIVGPAVGT